MTIKLPLSVAERSALNNIHNGRHILGTMQTLGEMGKLSTELYLNEDEKKQIEYTETPDENGKVKVTVNSEKADSLNREFDVSKELLKSLQASMKGLTDKKLITSADVAIISLDGKIQEALDLRS